MSERTITRLLKSLRVGIEYLSVDGGSSAKNTALLLNTISQTFTSVLISNRIEDPSQGRARLG